MADDKGVTSRFMFRLACKVDSGVFSHERLIRFLDASGAEQAALVDQSVVEVDGDSGWVGVVKADSRDERSLISLPSDGSRVWVPSSSLKAG